MHSVRRTSERTQYHIELGLQLCDSSELDAQLLFSIGEPLVYGPERFGGESLEPRVKPRVLRPKQIHFSDPRARMPELGTTAVLNSTGHPAVALWMSSLNSRVAADAAREVVVDAVSVTADALARR
jgi:hypothetical protein